MKRIGLVFASIIGFLALSALFSVKAQAATYYVAGDSGSDTTGNGSSGTPWKTIQKAASTMSFGDTVNVKGGITYSDIGSTDCDGYGGSANVCPVNSGSSGSYITYQAWSGTGIPIISVTGHSYGFFAGKDYLTVNGFEFSGAASESSVFLSDYNHHLIIKNNVVHGALTSDGIVGYSNSNVKIYNNTVYSTRQSIYFNVVGSETNLEAKNNLVFNNRYGLASNSSPLSGLIATDYNDAWNNVTAGGVTRNYYQVTNGANNISVDPLVVNYPSNLSLSGTSPLINSGINTSDVVTDIAGNPRPGGGTQDMGAYEYKQFYVAGDTGNDTTGKGTISLPWKTIQKAANVMIAGDTVNVKGGITYSASNACASLSTEVAVVCIKVSGSVGNYITYKAWPNTGIPVIDLPNGVGNGFGSIGVPGKSYIVIDGFKVVKTTSISSNNSGLIYVGLISSNYIVRNNVLIGGEKGIFAFGSGANIAIYNNIINGSSLTGVMLNSNSSAILRNNLITNNTVGIEIIGGVGTTDYNLLYGNVTNYSGIAAGAHDVTGHDPLVINTASGNFTLDPASPAIGAGTTLSDVITDILGVSRPQGTGYDIGAYEYYIQTVTINAVTPDPSSDNTPTVTGSASTISGATITSMEYMIDSGSWLTTGVSAVDGVFDEQSEDYTITIPSALSDGSHTIYVRIGADSNGTRSSSALDTFTIDTSTPEPVITDLGKIDEVPNKDSLYYYFTSPTATIKGNAEANSTIYFKRGEDTYTGSTDTKGAFTVKLTNLPSGLVNLIYYTIDRVGNKSSERSLILVIGVENFPDWLLTELGLNPSTVTSETTVNEEDLDTQNDQQDEVQDDIEENNGLPVTGEDNKAEEQEDKDRTNDQVKKLLVYCLPIIVVLLAITGGFIYLTKNKKEKQSRT